MTLFSLIVLVLKLGGHCYFTPIKIFSSRNPLFKINCAVTHVGSISSFGKLFHLLSQPISATSTILSQKKDNAIKLFCL